MLDPGPFLFPFQLFSSLKMRSCYNTASILAFFRFVNKANFISFFALVLVPFFLSNISKHSCMETYETLQQVTNTTKCVFDKLLNNVGYNGFRTFILLRA